MSPSPLTEALSETLGIFEESGPPLTTPEVADRLDLGRRSTYERLDRLVDHGELDTKKAGANARVWWRPGRSSATGEDRLGPNDEQFELLVNAVEEYAIFMLDADGRVTTWNQGAERIKGYEREDVLGEHVSTFYTAEDRQGGVPEGNLEDAAAVGVTTDEGWRVRGDGSRFWAHVTITAIEDEAGDLRGYAKVTRDMTDHRSREQELRDERNLLDRILETSPIGIGVFQPGGSVDRMNARLAELLELSEEDVDGYALGDRELFDSAEGHLSYEESPAGRVSATGAPVFDREVRIEEADGGDRWLSVNAAPLADETGELDRVVATVTDVTHRREQARRLERQRDDLESELAEVYERIDDAFYALDDQFRFTYVNERAEELLDATEAELLGDRIWDRYPGAAETSVWDAFHRAMATQEPTDYEVYRDSLGFWVEANVYPSESGLSVYFRDVTERVTRERQFEEYRRIVETVEDGVYVVDRDLRIQFVNEGYTSITGYDREDLIGAHISTVVDEDVVDLTRERREELLAGDSGGSVEIEMETASGETIVVDARYAPLFDEDDGFRGTVGIVRDVSERKERERELRQYERIVETVDDGVYVLDEAREFTRVNPAFVSMTRFDREELMGTHASAVFGSKFDRLDGEARRLVEAGETEVAAFEEEIHTAAGETITAESRFKPFEVAGGSGRVGVIRDITERRARERELERYRTVVETVDDGIYLVDADGRFTMVNERYAEMTGYPREELIGASVSKVVDTGTANEARAFERELATGERETVKYEADLNTAAGDTIRAEATFALLPGDDDEYERVGVVRDVSERVEHERKLRAQRERLAALDDLNRIVRDLSVAVINQSTREEIERVVCEGLADSASYEFAWIGDVDPKTQTVQLRTEAGVEGYTDDLTISVDPDDPRGRGPTGRAIRTQRVQMTEDVLTDESYAVWRERAREYGFRSSAAIPIVHEDVRYGVINVYADRTDAFTGDERAVIEHVGEIVGHAIAAVERKRALTSDEVVELEFRIPAVFDAFDLPETDGRLTLDRAVPLGDGRYLEYGSTTGEMLDSLESLVDTLPHWESVRTFGEATAHGTTRFELLLHDPPVLSTVTALGGYVERAIVEDGDYAMRIHLAPSADVRRLIDHVRETYPMAQLVSRQQVARDPDSPTQLLGMLTEHLTDRQRSALEAAYFAGYFEWPRDVTGEGIAESLGVAAPTFHQHLRRAQQKLLQVIMADSPPA